MSFYIKTFTSLILITLTFSCNGQKNTEAQQEVTSPTNSEIIYNQEFNPFIQSSKTDSLFFIEGQLCQHLRRIFEDSKGNLWFGTNVYGLMRYDGDKLVYYNENDGLGGGRITAIVEDSIGSIWFGTYKGLTKYDGEKFINYTIDDGLLDNEIWSLIIDRNNIFWIGTNKGVSRFNGQTFNDFKLPKAKIKDTTTTYSYDRITTILEDKNGHFWFGTDGFGITKYDKNAFSYITKAEGLPGNNISEIMEDTKGNIWIASNGLSRYNDNTFTHFTAKDNLKGEEVSDIYEDKNGVIWLAVENYGIYSYDGKEFINFYKNNGLPTNGILSILKDSKNRFWFGGWGGLFRFDDKTFSSVTKNGPWN